MTNDIAQRRSRIRERFEHWQPRSLGDWHDVCASEYGSRPLVVTDERELSYRGVCPSGSSSGTRRSCR